MHELNECAVNNVKDYLIVEMDKWKEAEKQARLEGKIEKCIEMYHDMSYLYEKLLSDLEDKTKFGLVSENSASKEIVDMLDLFYANKHLYSKIQRKDLEKMSSSCVEKDEQER